MFYKYEENTDTYHKGNTITLPNGEVLNEDNKLELDGWEWFVEEPQEYIDWKERKEFEDFKMLEKLNY